MDLLSENLKDGALKVSFWFLLLSLASLSVGLCNHFALVGSLVLGIILNKLNFMNPIISLTVSH